MAVLDGLRCTLHGEYPAACKELLEVARDEAVVGSVVSDAEGDGLALDTAERQVHFLGCTPWSSETMSE